MVKPMRRARQLVDDMATLKGWLDEATVGRLSTTDENGYPIAKPVNFVYADDKIYFHSARVGEKLDDIRRDSRVGFEIDKVYAVTPAPERGCETHCFYQSIVIRGKARILDDIADRNAKEKALRLLLNKYSPSFAEAPLHTAEKTSVVEIAVEHISGKEDFGQGWPMELRLTVAKLLIERDGDAAAETIAKMGLNIDQVLGT